MPTRSRRPSRGLSLGIVLGAIGCALALGACGGSSAPAKRASTSGTGGGSGFSDCMRAHGVTDFPDPLPGGGFNIPPSINPRSPAFIAAQKACQAPGSTPTTHKTTRAEVTRAVQFSKCMRGHGITDFPDPIQGTPPATIPRGDGGILRLGGMYYVLSMGELTPAFQTATIHCGLHPHDSGAPA